MPPLETMDRKNDAVLWEFTRADRQGEPLVLSPVDLKVRWEEGQFERADAEGNLLVVDVVICTNRDIKLNSLMWEGTLEELEEMVGTVLAPRSGLYEVVTRNRADDLKKRHRRWEFGLRRYKNRMPRIVT